MLWGFISAAFLMGLVGGPHCLAMCGSVCNGLNAVGHRQIWSFQLGRALSYAVLGALAAAMVQSLAWAGVYLTILKPVMTAILVLVLAWGLMLLIYARQPLWAYGASDWLWHRVRDAGRTPSRSLRLGMAWIAMPCGFLYSAIFLAALSGGAWQGALVMLAFAGATTLWLAVFAKFSRRLNQWRQAWGQRLAGLLLSLSAAWSLWIHVTETTKLFC